MTTGGEIYKIINQTQAYRYLLLLVATGGLKRYDLDQLVENKKDDGGWPYKGIRQGILQEVYGYNWFKGLEKETWAYLLKRKT